MDLEAISSNLQFLWRKRGIKWLFVCGGKREFQVYFVKSSKSETQHHIHQILLTCYWNTTKEIGVPAWSAWNVKKYFKFAVKFVKSSKSKTQHGIHKIYSHVIETPPSKSKTQHEVHEMWKGFRVCCKLLWSQASRGPNMVFTKFTHTLLKHHLASQGPNIECMKHKRILKNINTKLQNKWILKIESHN